VDIFFSEEKAIPEEFIKGLKSPELLDSALKSCQQTFDGVDLWPDLFSKAACIFRSLIQNHAFHDGNKRTALMTLIIFLSENGYYLHYNDQSELVRFALRVAKHKQIQVTTIREWIHKRVRKKADNKKTWKIVKEFNYIFKQLIKESQINNTEREDI
jgi:death-on-curing protein